MEQTNKIVKLIPTGPVYAAFDFTEQEGVQFMHGTLVFTDQFGLERRHIVTGESAIAEIGKKAISALKGEETGQEPSPMDMIKNAYDEQRN